MTSEKPTPTWIKVERNQTYAQPTEAKEVAEKIITHQKTLRTN
jgi:hypothetical protein